MGGSVEFNGSVRSYYDSVESKVGYRLLLGGSRHFGYYDKAKLWPFPLGDALRAMEDKLGHMLSLERGSNVLDAGCGVGHVAVRLANKFGFLVQGIDIVDDHVAQAQRNVHQAGLDDGRVQISKLDYHFLTSFVDGSFDGVYTMESFVHAREARDVLGEFFRVTRPGGRLVLFEYEHDCFVDAGNAFSKSMKMINSAAAMPTNEISRSGVIKEMVESAGYADVVVCDMSDNILPMTRFFCVLGYIPWMLVRLLGVEKHFINTVAGVESYRGRQYWRYIAISASKPVQ